MSSKTNCLEVDTFPQRATNAGLMAMCSSAAFKIHTHTNLDKVRRQQYLNRFIVFRINPDIHVIVKVLLSYIFNGVCAACVSGQHSLHYIQEWSGVGVVCERPLVDSKCRGYAIKQTEEHIVLMKNMKLSFILLVLNSEDHIYNVEQ